MHAITVSEYGAAPTVTEVDDPHGGPGQILIDIGAAGVNPMDRTISNGGFASRMPATFPMIVGSDMSGVVTAVGDTTSKFSPGDEVFGQLLISPLGSAGTYAEQVAVVNETMAAKYWPNADPVVGMVHHLRHGPHSVCGVNARLHSGDSRPRSRHQLLRPIGSGHQ